MVKVSNSGTTDTEKTEHDVAAPSAIARSQSHHNRHTHLPAIPSSQPSPPPPHDDEEVVLQFLDVEETSHPLPDTPHHSPPPPPSKKTFYDKNNGKLPHANNEGSPTFLKRWMARYPILARHPRRFVALLFTFGTLLLLFIILLSIRLSQGDGSGDSGGGGWIGDSRGGTFPIDPKTEQDLRKHNRDLTKPPINRSNEPGWTSSGRGDGTYYDPSVRNSAGGFQQGACEFEYINSVTEFIVALNKPDFGPYPRASKSPACGQCLKVKGPGGTVQVQVVDMCPSCKSGALDLSPAAFAKIAHIDQGRVPISWERCS